MNTEKAIFNLPDGCKEITILQGDAVKPLPLKEPKSITLSGDIHAVSNYVAIRNEQAAGIQVLNPKTAIVEVNKNARTIVFHSDPESHYGVTVTAKLEQSNELARFGINTDTRYDRKQLLKLLKFSRMRFGDIGTYNQVINGLMKIRFKTSAEIAQESDGKGNKVNNDESHTVADAGFVDKFTLSVPLFNGFDPVKIEVEICWEVLSSNISFWLESIGLPDAVDGAIKGIFDTELANVKDYVTIYK